MIFKYKNDTKQRNPMVSILFERELPFNHRVERDRKNNYQRRAKHQHQLNKDNNE